MKLFLQHPAFLPLLGLAVLPVLVHLFSRAKPPRYRFSNVEFLRQVLRVTNRFRKPKDWLLLALRTLAILALAAAFLGPLLLSRNSALPGERRTLVLLVDRSASMGAREGAGTRFEAACAAAVKLLDSSRPDLANVVWIDASPDAVFPDPGPNRGFLVDELGRAGPRAEPGALEAAFQLAARQFQNAEGRRELCILSDFQASAWKDFTPVLPPGVEVRVLPVAKEDVPNVAVTSLVPTPAAPVAGQQLLVQCRVANRSGEARRVPLTLDAGGSRQSRQLDLPPHGEAEASFTVRCPASGLMPITAETDGDNFPGDDRRHAIVRVRESLRLAVAAPESSATARTLANVARALPWLDVIPGADPRQPPPCEILFLPAWDGADPAALRTLAENGTTVLVQPAPACPGAAIATLANTPPDAAASPVSLETQPAGWEAAPSADAAEFKLFADGGFGNPLAGRFRQRLRLGNLPGTKLVARFNDGTPALLEAPGLPIVIWNLPLDPAVTDWPEQSTFLPAIGEILRHHAPGRAAERFTANPGDPLAWTNPAAGETAAPVLERPDGTPVDLEPAGDGGLTVWRSKTPAEPGIWRWLVSDQPVHLVAVNFPESESDLKPLDPPPAFGSASPADAGRQAALDQGLPLWPWLAAAALSFLVVEAVVATLKPRRASSPSLPA